VNSLHVTKVINSSDVAECISSFHKGTCRHNLYVTSRLHMPPTVATVRRFDPVGGHCWTTSSFAFQFGSGEVHGLPPRPVQTALGRALIQQVDTEDSVKVTPLHVVQHEFGWLHPSSASGRVQGPGCIPLHRLLIHR
jgi:hypothetical protein